MKFSTSTIAAVAALLSTAANAAPVNEARDSEASRQFYDPRLLRAKTESSNEKREASEDFYNPNLYVMKEKEKRDPEASEDVYNPNLFVLKEKAKRDPEASRDFYSPALFGDPNKKRDTQEHDLYDWWVHAKSREPENGDTERHKTGFSKTEVVPDDAAEKVEKRDPQIEHYTPHTFMLKAAENGEKDDLEARDFYGPLGLSQYDSEADPKGALEARDFYGPLGLNAPANRAKRGLAARGWYGIKGFKAAEHEKRGDLYSGTTLKIKAAEHEKRNDLYSGTTLKIKAAEHQKRADLYNNHIYLLKAAEHEKRSDLYSGTTLKIKAAEHQKRGDLYNNNSFHIKKAEHEDRDPLPYSPWTLKIIEKRAAEEAEKRGLHSIQSFKAAEHERRDIYGAPWQLHNDKEKRDPEASIVNPYRWQLKKADDTVEKRTPEAATEIYPQWDLDPAHPGRNDKRDPEAANLYT